MTEFEKATELIEKYVDIQSQLKETSFYNWEYATKCALIAVDEIISDTNASSPFQERRLKYWKEVRTIIELRAIY